MAAFKQESRVSVLWLDWSSLHGNLELESDFVSGPMPSVRFEITPSGINQITFGSLEKET